MMSLAALTKLLGYATTAAFSLTLACLLVAARRAMRTRFGIRVSERPTYTVIYTTTTTITRATNNHHIYYHRHLTLRTTSSFSGTTSRPMVTWYALSLLVCVVGLTARRHLLLPLVPVLRALAGSTARPPPPTTYHTPTTYNAPPAS